MFLMQRHRLTRCLALSLYSSLTDKSFLMLFNHIRFGPRILSPGTSITITLLSTYSSSQYMPIPLQHNFLHFLWYFPHLHCHFKCFIPCCVQLGDSTHPSSFKPHPTSYLVISSLPMSRHRTSLLVLNTLVNFPPWLSSLFFGHIEPTIPSSSVSVLIVCIASSPHPSLHSLMLFARYIVETSKY